jgi:RecB family exonuclease
VNESWGQVTKLRTIRGVEEQFDLMIGSLPLPFIGIVDLVAEMNGGTAVIDLKTGASGYGAYEVALSDQLTAYSLAEPKATEVAYCVFVKTKAAHRVALCQADIEGPAGICRESPAER